MCQSCWETSCVWCTSISKKIENVHKIQFDCSSCDMSCDSCNILTVKKFCNWILTLWCLSSEENTNC